MTDPVTICMTAPAPLAYTYEAAAAATGVSMQSLKRAVARGVLVAHYPTPRPVILADDLRGWLEASPTILRPQRDDPHETLTVRRRKGAGSLYLRADGLWVATLDLPIGPDGKRRRRSVSSKSKTVAKKKLRALREELKHA